MFNTIISLDLARFRLDCLVILWRVTTLILWFFHFRQIVCNWYVRPFQMRGGHVIAASPLVAVRGGLSNPTTFSIRLTIHYRKNIVIFPIIFISFITIIFSLLAHICQIITFHIQCSLFCYLLCCMPKVFRSSVSVGIIPITEPIIPLRIRIMKVVWISI